MISCHKNVVSIIILQVGDGGKCGGQKRRSCNVGRPAEAADDVIDGLANLSWRHPRFTMPGNRAACAKPCSPRIPTRLHAGQTTQQTRRTTTRQREQATPRRVRLFGSRRVHLLCLLIQVDLSSCNAQASSKRESRRVTRIIISSQLYFFRKKKVLFKKKGESPSLSYL